MKPGLVHVDLEELGVFKLASPCRASWRKMQGDDRVRFCAGCSLHVYNLAAMTYEEIRTVIREKEGRLCMRFFRRRDGTVITRDCPKGMRILKLFWRERPQNFFRVPWKALGFTAAGFALAFVVFITLFGDNIRRLFSMSAGDMVAVDPVVQQEPRGFHNRRAPIHRDDAY